MTDSFARFCFFLLAIPAAAALQDVCPAYCEVKWPFLLTLALWFPYAYARTRHSLTFTALFIGLAFDGMNDAVFSAGTVFMLAAAFAMAILRPFLRALPSALVGFAAVGVAAPALEVWSASWSAPAASVTLRFFVGALEGMAAGAVLFPLLNALAYHAGLPRPGGLPATREAA